MNNPSGVPMRGRPREFDIDVALMTGQQLFHRDGYGSVGVAKLTDRLAIRPSSFYAAFGSKGAFLGRVLERYARTTLPLEVILAAGRPVDEALRDLLQSAARLYAADPDARGCLVLETARGDDEEGRRLSRAVAEAQRARIEAFVARDHPVAAELVTDIVVVTMSGLSASARSGLPPHRLFRAADAAATAITVLLRRDPWPNSGIENPQEQT